jgi:DNA-binding transcriptional LysR family regulator
MDLELLRTFVALTDAPTMTEAATRRRVTKSALSQQLKTLESRLGLSLFERSRHGLTPTAAAIELASSLRHAFTIADDAVAALHEAHNLVRGEVRIGAPRPFAQAKLAGTFGNLLAQHPELLLDISFGTPSDLEARLRAGDIDLAVLTRAPDNQSAILQSTPIFQETFELAASPKYLARYGTPKSADDFSAQDHRFVVFDRDEPMHEAWWRATFGARTKKQGTIIARAASLDMMLALVRAGACLGVLPSYFINDHQQRAIVTLKIPRAKQATSTSTIHLAWRKGTSETARFLAAKNAIVRSLE